LVESSWWCALLTKRPRTTSTNTIRSGEFGKWMDTICPSQDKPALAKGAVRHTTPHTRRPLSLWRSLTPGEPNADGVLLLSHRSINSARRANADMSSLLLDQTAFVCTQALFFGFGWAFFRHQLFRDYEVKTTRVQLLFSFVFALSCSLFELIILEILDVFSRE
jgi:hypothetical protein